MKVDSFGQIILNEQDICNLYLQNTQAILKDVLVDKPITFDSNLELENIPSIQVYTVNNSTVTIFDKQQQAVWHMPQAYYDLDIAEWVLLACNNDAELQRCGAELLRYAELDMLTLLQYLKYLVDTMRLNNIVWGVGRGSSVSSYVLYKIGVHKIDSMYYDLDYTEFLR